MTCHSCGYPVLVSDLRRPDVRACVRCEYLHYSHAADVLTSPPLPVEPVLPAAPGTSRAGASSSVVSRPAFSSLGPVAAAPEAVLPITPGRTEAAPNQSPHFPRRSLRAGSARQQTPPTQGNIRAALAFVVFAAVAMFLPEIIGWIGGAL